MPSAKTTTNVAVIAAAGSGKTELVVDSALADSSQRVLLSTYTNENLRQIIRRLEASNGVVPSNIAVMGWFSFLMNQAARPYQRAIADEANFFGSLNFKGRRSRFTRRADWSKFYFDQNRDIYRDGVSDFACRVDELMGGRVIKRLEAMYDHIYIDEVQDLVGYDLDFLDLLFKSQIRVTVVGDPRQHTFRTNESTRNKQYRGAGLMQWFEERQADCKVDPRTDSWRCNQAICDWADKLFPKMSPTTSQNSAQTGHDGIFKVASEHVAEYAQQYNPVVLRHDKRTNTLGLPAINIRVSKGSTYERVLIFPTDPIRRYLRTGDLGELKEPERLYVAVTRARHSVAFVVPSKEADWTPDR